MKRNKYRTTRGQRRRILTGALVRRYAAPVDHPVDVTVENEAAVELA